MGQLLSNALDAEKQEFLASLPEVPELGCLSYLQLNVIIWSSSKKKLGEHSIIIFHNRLQPGELFPDPSFWTLPRVPCSPKSSKSLEGCHPQQLDEGRSAPRPHDTSKDPNAAPCFPCRWVKPLQDTIHHLHHETLRQACRYIIIAPQFAQSPHILYLMFET